MKFPKRARLNLVFLLMAGAVFSAGIGFAAETSDREAYLQATQLFNQKDWEGAKKKFLEFQAQYPGSSWHWAAALRLADLESDPARAEKMYQEVLAHTQGQEWASDARWSLANTLYTAGHYAESLPHFLALASGKDVRRIRALYQAALCQMALKKFEDARESFKALLSQYPDSEWAAPSLAGLGDSEAASGNRQAAQAAYAEYLKKYPQGDLAASLGDKIKKTDPAAASSETPASSAPAASAASRGRGPESGPKFCVQVGAFTKPEYAQALVKKLKSKGYSAYILDASSGTEVFHQVRVGKYNQRALAEKIALQLGKKEKLPTVVAPVPEK